MQREQRREELHRHLQLYDVHAFKDAVSGDMTTVEKPNDAALAFEANAEYIAQILEEALSRLQIEHTQKEKVKTALGLAYQELAAQSQQLRDENTEKNQKIHELAQLQQVLRQEVDEKQRTLNQVAELQEHERKLGAALNNLKKNVDLQQATECPICLLPECDSVLSPCGHLYHHECINEYFQRGHLRADLTVIRGTFQTKCLMCSSEKGPPIARDAIDKKCKENENGQKEVWDQYVILIGGGRPQTREQLEEDEKRVQDAQARAAAGNADAAAAGP